MERSGITYQPYGLVVSVAGIGAFLTTLDVGIINIALPYLKTAFNTKLTTIAWTITAYTLALSATIIFFGRLSDRIGRLKIFKYGVIIFGIASLLCGFAQSALQIIICRIIQGIGASMIQATAVALITTLIPEKQHPRALGTFGTMLGFGNILGASLGGLLISLLGWPWVFWINIPLCFFVIWGVYQFNCTFPKVETKIDYLGIMLIAMTAIFLLLGIEWLAMPKTRIFSLYAGIICFLLICAFIFWEKITKVKLVDFKYFLNQQMGTLSIATIAFASTLSLYLIIPPLYLQKTTTLVPWQIGLVTFCGPLGYIITSQFTGRLMQKFCKKYIMLSGEIIILFGMFLLSFMQETWSIYYLASLLILVGVGGGLLFAPNVASIMEQVPRDIQGTAGAYNRMVHNFGISLGAAVAALCIQVSQNGDPAIFNIHGYQYTWVVGIVIVTISFILFLITKLPEKKRSEMNSTIASTFE